MFAYKWNWVCYMAISTLQWFVFVLSYFSKLTMHLQDLCDRNEFLFTLWYSDIQRHVFYYPNRWGITLYVSIFFLFKELMLVFGWDRGFLFSCCWWCFITGSFKEELFNTNSLSHLLWVDMGLLMTIAHPKDPHSETLQLRAFS